MHTLKAPSVNFRLLISFLIGILLTMSIYHYSGSHPLDVPYYYPVLFILGLCWGFIVKNIDFYACLGLIVGQLIYSIFFIPPNPFILLGIFYIVICGVIFIFGDVLGIEIKNRIRPSERS